MNFTYSRLSLAFGLILALSAVGCGNDATNNAVDLGTLGEDSGATDLGVSDAAAVDAGVADLGASADSGGETDAALVDGGGEFLTAMSCEGLTPITTIHSSLAGGYVPQNIAVNVGDIVKWVNDDSGIDHTVWSTGFAPSLNAGESFCLQFTVPASYDYACYFHPSMTGSVQVNP